MFSTLILLLSAAAALAKGSCAEGIYHSPKADSFIVVDVRSTLPTNVTTPAGVLAVFPFMSGNITGQFEGVVATNLSVVTEKILPGSDGQNSDVSNILVLESDSEVDANGEPQRTYADMHGTTQYANSALHGFGFATLSTTIKELSWVNFATFLVEWETTFETGKCSFEFFNVTTGGRLDGKAIPALEKPRKK